MSRIQLYRPSNGTEGMIFMARWCGRCRRDQGDGCGISMSTMTFEVDDPNYPREWRYVDGVPTCTAFVDATIPIVRSHKPGRTQLPLFDDGTDWLPVLAAADLIDETDPKRATRIRELVALRNPKAVELAKAVKPEFFAKENANVTE